MKTPDPAAEPIRRKALSGQVAERLRDGIPAGLYAPGEQLREVELARRYGVSRGPLRAIRRHVHELRRSASRRRRDRTGAGAGLLLE